MSYHGKLQVLKNGTADAEIQLWAYQQLKKELTLTDEDVKYNVTVKWDDKTTHHKNVSDGTPLHYNEPKTLTDEEIRNIAKEIDLESGVAQWKYDFARAILRKAQEK